MTGVVHVGQPFVAVPSEPGYSWFWRFSRQTCPSACEPKPLISRSYLRTVCGSLRPCTTGPKNLRCTSKHGPHVSTQPTLSPSPFTCRNISAGVTPSVGDV
jgi:hypothetical protein